MAITFKPVEMTSVNVGKGEPLRLFLGCAGDATAVASGTITLNAAPTLGGAKVVQQVYTITPAQLNKGYYAVLPSILTGAFLSVSMTLFTAGTLTAAIVLDGQTNE